MNEVKRLRPECISCIVRGNLEKFPETISVDQQVEYKQKLLTIVGTARNDLSSPVLSKKIKELQADMFGIHEDYEKIKSHFNRLMLSFEDQIMKDVNQSEDPLYLAIEYAMLGNYIDFGAMDSVDEDYLKELLKTAKNRDFDKTQYERLKTDLEKGKKLIFLTDNCGEIVMDKILIRTIQRLYPHIHVSVIVRGKPIINDATMKDAKQVGMDQIAHVIPNGSGIPGTFYEELSQEAQNEMDTADIILAKGQGNFETLRMCQRNVYYIFLCKCEMFARIFGVPRFTGILINDEEVIKKAA